MYEGLPNRVGRRNQILALREADAILGRSGYLPNRQYEQASALARRTPASRPGYPFALSISDMILNDKGIDIRSSTGAIRLPPILVKMDDVFERYVKNVLVASSDEIVVRDGNTWPPAGAKRPLVDAEPVSDLAKRVPI